MRKRRIPRIACIATSSRGLAALTQIRTAFVCFSWTRITFIRSAAHIRGFAARIATTLPPLELCRMA